MIARGLEAIAADRRPGDEVLVVADRCTDATAEIARGFGAAVLERGEDEEPGRAAARQAGLEYARDLEWDAVLMLDADSVIEPGFFAACEQALLDRRAGGAGAQREQPAAARWRRQASLAAFTLQGITIPRGRDRLGLSVRLRGTGMAIRRDLALDAPLPGAGVRGPRLHARPAARRRALPPRRRRAPALGRCEQLGHVRRPEGPLRGGQDGCCSRLCAAPAAPRRSGSATRRAWRPRGSSRRRRSRWGRCRSVSPRLLAAVAGATGPRRGLRRRPARTRD